MTGEEAEALRDIAGYAGPGTFEAEVDCAGFVRLAAGLLDAPLALITLRGEAPDQEASPRAWIGFGAEDAARAASAAFHAHAAGVAAGPFVMPDAAADGRFAANPAVAGAPRVRFYAGMPLIGRGEAVLGVLSVFDTEPRPALGDRQAADLRFLAEMVMQRLEFARLYAVALASARIAASTPDAIICANTGSG